MIDEDAVTGITSNPSIFQKAIAKAARLRRADAGAARDEPTTRPRSSSRSRSTTCATRATCCGRSGSATDGAGRLRLARGRPDARATTTDETLEQAIELHDAVDRPNVYIKIPATRRGPAGDRGLDRARRLDQRHADLLARALRGGRRGLHPRARAARRRRRRPVEGRVGRVVLRLAHRHRGRQAARGASATRSCRASSAIDNAKLAYKHFQEAFAGPALGARSPRRARACSGRSGPRPRRRTRPTATCIYVEELIGPDTVNTMPPETVDGVPGSRRGARRHGARGRRRGASGCSTSCARPASTTTTSSQTLEVEGVQKFADVVRRADRRASRAKRGELARDLTTERARARRADLVARPDRLDGRGRGAAGSAGSTSRRAMREDVDLLLDARRRRRRARSTTSCCSAWAARRSRPRCCGRRFGGERFHVLDTTHPAAIRALEATARPRAHAVRLARRSRARRSRRARTPTTSGSSRRAASSGSRSPIPARRSSGLAREREFARRLRRASRRSAAATRRSRRSGSCRRR